MHLIHQKTCCAWHAQLLIVQPWTVMKQTFRCGCSNSPQATGQSLSRGSQVLSQLLSKTPLTLFIFKLSSQVPQALLAALLRASDSPPMQASLKLNCHHSLAQPPICKQTVAMLWVCTIHIVICPQTSWQNVATGPDCLCSIGIARIPNNKDDCCGLANVVGMSACMNNM